MRRLTNVIRPEFSVAAYRLRQQPQREAGEVLAALAVAQPVGDEREPKSISLRNLASTGSGFEEMHLDEFAELVGDTVPGCSG